jgi:hypothetical protein
VRDTLGASLAEALDLGPLEECPRSFTLSMRVPATAIVEVTTDGGMPDAENPATVGGRLVFGCGMLVRCTLGRDPSGAAPAAWKTTIVAVRAGRTLHFPEQLAPFQRCRAASELQVAL